MEDGDEGIQEDYGEEDETVVQVPPRQYVPKKPCNQRLEELATPFRRKFLALWHEHAYHLPRDKNEHLRQLLQELYAMTPEETAKYFDELKSEAKAAAIRKKIKQKLRRYLLDKHNKRQKQKAYRLFKKILSCGMKYAINNPVPELVSIRLRYLSDIILDQLCQLRNIDTPSREEPDKVGTFMIAIADWLAIAIERLYYEAQSKINNEMRPREPTNDTRPSLLEKDRQESTMIDPAFEWDDSKARSPSLGGTHHGSASFNPAVHSTPKRKSKA